MTPWTDNSRRLPTLLLLSSTLLFPPAVALSQTEPEPPVEDEIAGSAYARVRHLEGEIFVEGTYGARDGDDLLVNAPIVPGDRVTTGVGRVEIQLADGSLVRLDRATQVETAALSDLANQLEQTNWLLLPEGSLYVYVEGMASSEEVFRLDTPLATVYLLSQGVFRIDSASHAGPTTVTSHNGVAEVVAEGYSVLVRSGEKSDVAPHRPPSDPRAFNPFSLDAFDRWNRERQAAYVKPYEYLPARDVPEEITPYVTELAYYGDWIQTDDYGWVWAPSGIAGDWAPYRVGRWYWAPTGWVWISYEPWGWAPYHYGRWEFTVGIGWYWIPGRVYSGAWVSWAIGPTYVGWCALNYYNYPIYHPYNPIRYPQHVQRAWVYAPHDDLPRRHATIDTAVRTDDFLTRAVLVNKSPGRDAATIGAQVRHQPAPDRRVDGAAPAGDLVSFRTIEGRGRSKTEPIAVPPPRSSADAANGPPRGRNVSFGSGPAARTPAGVSTPKDDGRMRNYGQARRPRSTPVMDDGTAKSSDAAPSRPSAVPRPGADATAPGSSAGGQRPANREPQATPSDGARGVDRDDRSGVLRRLFLHPPSSSPGDDGADRSPRGSTPSAAPSTAPPTDDGRNAKPGVSRGATPPRAAPLPGRRPTAAPDASADRKQPAARPAPSRPTPQAMPPPTRRDSANRPTAQPAPRQGAGNRPSAQPAPRQGAGNRPSAQPAPRQGAGNRPSAQPAPRQGAGNQPSAKPPPQKPRPQDRSASDSSRKPKPKPKGDN